MDALAAIGKFKAGVERVVTPVIGVLSVIGAVVALFTGHLPIALGLVLLAGLMYMLYSWAGIVEKDKTLQTVSGGIEAANMVGDVLSATIE